MVKKKSDTKWSIIQKLVLKTKHIDWPSHFKLQKVQYSKVSSIQIVGIQIPTVFTKAGARKFCLFGHSLIHRNYYFYGLITEIIYVNKIASIF